MAFIQVLIFSGIASALVAYVIARGHPALSAFTPNVCLRCGYGLTGLGERSVCPECGTNTHQSVGEKVLRARQRRVVNWAWLAGVVAAALGVGVSIWPFGAQGLLIAVPFVVAPFACIACLPWVLTPKVRDRAAMWMTMGAHLACLGLVVYAFVDTAIGPRDALDGLVLVFGPLYGLLVAGHGMLGGVLIAMLMSRDGRTREART